ncbi:MAG: hypothetical protein K2O21_02855 [Malacoplasma sp.]|nr:hypothetical protein [Malacoplasma sp.]
MNKILSNFNLLTILKDSTSESAASTDVAQTTTTTTTTAEVQFPTYLIVLIAILIGIAIIACIYKIFAYRRISIAAKKIDYLVEDLIYKSEYIMPSIEAVSEFASYTNLADLVFNRGKKNNSNKIKEKTNKEIISKAKKIEHEEIVNELSSKNSKNKKETQKKNSAKK